MTKTIEINGSNYEVNFSKSYLNQAEQHLIKSKIDKQNEVEHLTKAQQLIDRARINNIIAKTELQNNNFILKDKPKTRFSDISGLEDVKEKIKLKVIEPLKNPKLFELFNKKFGGGIIMYGPPGCGKSFFAEATAGEAGVTYFNVKASDIKGRYVGETEKNISELFKLAKKNQPCVIFFDEFEALGRERGDAVGHDKSMVSHLLTEIDGLGNKDKQIMLIAATNEPWSIDLALRREGRFGKTIFIPPPDFEGRSGILKNKLNGKPVDPSFDFDLIVRCMENYSGADIMEVCEAAIEKVISRCLKDKKVYLITTNDLLGAIEEKTELITVKWFNKALKIIENDQSSFKELIEYVDNNLKAVAS